MTATLPMKEIKENHSVILTIQLPSCSPSLYLQKTEKLHTSKKNYTNLRVLNAFKHRVTELSRFDSTAMLKQNCGVVLLRLFVFLNKECQDHTLFNLLGQLLHQMGLQSKISEKNQTTTTLLLQVTIAE